MAIATCPKCSCQLEVKLSFASGPKSSSHASINSLGDLLDRIEMSTLDAREAEFVRSTKERFEQYGPNTRMSEKQMQWLKAISEKEVF